VYVEKNLAAINIPANSCYRYLLTVTAHSATATSNTMALPPAAAGHKPPIDVEEAKK